MGMETCNRKRGVLSSNEHDRDRTSFGKRGEFVAFMDQNRKMQLAVIDLLAIPSAQV